MLHQGHRPGLEKGTLQSTTIKKNGNEPIINRRKKPRCCRRGLCYLCGACKKSCHLSLVFICWPVIVGFHYLSIVSWVSFDVECLWDLMVVLCLVCLIGDPVFRLHRLFCLSLRWVSSISASISCLVPLVFHVLVWNWTKFALSCREESKVKVEVKVKWEMGKDKVKVDGR